MWPTSSEWRCRSRWRFKFQRVNWSAGVFADRSNGSNTRLRNNLKVSTLAPRSKVSPDAPGHGTKVARIKDLTNSDSRQAPQTRSIALLARPRPNGCKGTKDPWRPFPGLLRVGKTWIKWDIYSSALSVKKAGLGDRAMNPPTYEVSATCRSDERGCLVFLRR